MNEKTFYFVKDGKPNCTLVYGKPPFPPEIYDEVSSPEPVLDVSERQYSAILGLRNRIQVASGVELPVLTADEAKEVSGSKAVLGKTQLADLSQLGQTTSYQYVLSQKDGDMFTVAWTPGGYLDAIRKITEKLVVSEDKKDVYLPAKFFRTYDRILPEIKHAFPKFTISIYGAPGQEEDDRVFQDLVNFGIDMMPVYVNLDDPASIERARGLIKRFYENGITTRLYSSRYDGEKAFIEEGNYKLAEERVKQVVELFADMDEIEQWGFIDEPETPHFEYCAFVKRCYEKYDPKKRPVYINMGPRAHAKGVQTFYDRLDEMVQPDYYCLDRYPFFMDEKGSRVDEDYFYAHFELNRNRAIDRGKDAGIILAAIKVGGANKVAGNSREYADITPDFEKWQINLVAAYGYRYLEQYVYYYVHDYCILGPGLVPTFRWHIAKKANEYLHTIMPILIDKRLDAVFHLPRPDGKYDIDTVPYHPYRGVGEVSGVDALLSFFDDGTIIVTDKRCDDFLGGPHDVTLTGITGAVEWFNPDTAVWEEIGTCPALISLGESGLALHLERAAQYIIRETN